MSRKLLLIFFFAFLIRLIALNQSLWLDEATTARVVRDMGYMGIIRVFSPHDFHPPLFYWLEKFWTSIFGYSEISLRFPSVIFSLITGYFVYKIVRLFENSMVGIFATALFLFNPLIVYYSQEGRMYMMVAMFLTIALYYFLQLVIAIRQPAEKQSQNEIATAAKCGLAMTLSLFTFYGSVFLIAAFLLYFLYKKQYKNLFICLFVIFVDFLILSLLLFQQLINAKISLAAVSHWSSVLGKANLKDLLLIPVKFFIGRIDFYPKVIYYLISGIWVLFVLYVLFKNLIFDIKNSIKIKNFKLKILLVYLFIFPLLLGFVISFVTPLLQYFRFIYLIPELAILLAVCQPRRLTRLVLLGGFLIFSLIYLLLPQFHREDWKSLVKSLPKNQPVYMILTSSDPVHYYDNNLKVIELRELTSLRVNELAKQIVVIPYTADIYGFDYKSVLNKYKYKLVNEKTFRGDLIMKTYSL